jgi:hypothetical protein
MKFNMIQECVIPIGFNKDTSKKIIKCCWFNIVDSTTMWLTK